MRLIDADALEKILNDIWLSTSPRERDDRETVFERAAMCRGIDDCIKYVHDAPTIGGWIECTPDTMPETNDEVLTTYIVNGNKKRRFVESASWFYDGEEGHWNSVWDEYTVAGTRKEVLAWMPMPKPYRD